MKYRDIFIWQNCSAFLFKLCSVSKSFYQIRLFRRSVVSSRRIFAIRGIFSCCDALVRRTRKCFNQVLDFFGIIGWLGYSRIIQPVSLFSSFGNIGDVFNYIFHYDSRFFCFVDRCVLEIFKFYINYDFLKFFIIVLHDHNVYSSNIHNITAIPLIFIFSKAFQGSSKSIYLLYHISTLSSQYNH